MTDDIRALTARLADEPSSLAFLELGEALRRRGQLEAAYKVARGGLSRYPGLADAHDLLARILGDQGDLAGAFDAWADALRFDPMRSGALKGHRVPLLPRRRRDGGPGASRSALPRSIPDDESIPQASPGSSGRPAASAADRRPAGAATAPVAGGRRSRPLPPLGGAAGPASRRRAGDRSPFADLGERRAAACCWSTATGSG